VRIGEVPSWNPSSGAGEVQGLKVAVGDAGSLDGWLSWKGPDLEKKGKVKWLFPPLGGKKKGGGRTSGKFRAATGKKGGDGG